MPKTRPPHSSRSRRRMAESVHAGRGPEDLARGFEPTARSIRAWVVQAGRAEGRRGAKPAVDAAALSAAEREELARLRREDEQPRLERDILSRAAARSARETGAVPRSGSSGS